MCDIVDYFHISLYSALHIFTGFGFSADTNRLCVLYTLHFCYCQYYKLIYIFYSLNQEFHFGQKEKSRKHKKIPKEYEIVYLDHLTLPFTAWQIKKDFDISLTTPTHIKLILKRKG